MRFLLGAPHAVSALLNLDLGIERAELKAHTELDYVCWRASAYNCPPWAV